jgi:hypothetical protein
MAGSKVNAPFYPIVYVRGYAMTQDAVVETTSTPFMGFEAGSTKIRQAASGQIQKFIFESPIVRLMKDYGYRDIYEAGTERLTDLSPSCLVVHRYYDPADPDFGDGKAPSIETAAAQLSARILALRDIICGLADASDPQVVADRDAFRVYLVAHSMGGLIVRAFLQNKAIGDAAARAMVDKVFTYATPHNGIEMGGINVPGFLTYADLSNFNRGSMAKTLTVAADADGDVNSLGDAFPAERFFCLVGTNSRDYAVAHGLSSLAVGPLSDGLVKIQNAYVDGAPRAFVHRCHSGYFGIVNSEEGYQNLVRFLYGNLRATGTLRIEAAPFPPDVEAQRAAGKQVETAFYVETTVAVRGSYTFNLTERTQANGSAVMRNYRDLFDETGAATDDPRSPVLFSVFLDGTKSTTANGDIAFSIDLAVASSGYEIAGRLFSSHIPGEYLFRNTLALFARRSVKDGTWSLRYVWTDDKWASGPTKAADDATATADDDPDEGATTATIDAQGFSIPLKSAKGFVGTLHVAVSNWS